MWSLARLQTSHAPLLERSEQANIAILKFIYQMIGFSLILCLSCFKTEGKLTSRSFLSFLIVASTEPFCASTALGFKVDDYVAVPTSDDNKTASFTNPEGFPSIFVFISLFIVVVVKVIINIIVIKISIIFVSRLVIRRRFIVIAFVSVTSTDFKAVGNFEYLVTI